MAGRSDLLNHLVALLSSLDDDAYAALANKGLLRRARKDLASGEPPAIAEEQATTITVTVGAQRVVLDETGPSQASCSCPAPGCCQHILTACLWLSEQDVAAPAPAAEGVAQETPSLETIRKWAGADDFRRALRLVQADHRSTQDDRSEFVGDLEVRLIPGSPLDAAITNAPARLKRAYIAAGALAVLAAKGVELPFETAGRGPLRLELLADLQGLLEEAVETGLNHLSRSMLARLHSLSIQCRVGGLIRVSLEAESCAKEIDWLLERHARADQARFFDRMTRLHALAESIRQQGQNAAEAYVGSVRSRYGEIGTLDLVGVGCYPWETDSGFVGLTMLFWSRTAGLYYSWSDSRPKHSLGGFTAEQRFRDASPWAGGRLLMHLARNRFVLTQARANPERRLSAHAGSKVEDATEMKVEDLPSPVEEWRELLERERPGGLLRGSPLDDLVLVKAKRWERPFFDEIEQALVIPLIDREEALLPLRLPYSHLTAGGLFHLEAHRAEPERDWLLGYYRRQPSPHLFPIRLYRIGTPNEAIDLLFQPLPRKKVTFHGRTFEKWREFVPLPQSEEAGPATMESGDPLGILLSPIADRLLQAAEGGFSGGGLTLGREVEVLRRVGLEQLGVLVARAASARDLLRAGYCLTQLQDCC